MLQRRYLAVAFAQRPGTIFDALSECPTFGLGAAVGFAVLQRAGMFLAQADGFTEPEALQAASRSNVPAEKPTASGRTSSWEQTDMVHLLSNGTRPSLR